MRTSISLLCFQKWLFFIVCLLYQFIPLYAQTPAFIDDQTAITTLIAQYAQAREAQDTMLLKSILTEDIDQLVSSGEWRRGINTAVQGMQRSSGNNPGTRTLTVKHIRMLDSNVAVVDARYVIERTDGSARRMWSTFLVKRIDGQWKIAAIRNMLPTGP